MIQRSVSPVKMICLLLIGLLGCLTMGAGDWIMIYGDPGYTGNLAWLTKGAAGISPRQNAMAMALAFPAILFYAAGLSGVSGFLTQPRRRKTYLLLTAAGLLPWLCLHLMYTQILFLFGWLHQNGHPELANPICEAVFSQFVWMVPLCQVIMALPFLYLFAVTLSGGTALPRLYALNNPLILYIPLKLLSMIPISTDWRLPFINGLMSESMLIWFLVLLFGTRWLSKEKPQKKE